MDAGSKGVSFGGLHRSEETAPTVIEKGSAGAGSSGTTSAWKALFRVATGINSTEGCVRDPCWAEGIDGALKS
jgi:hypothetical protein